MSSIVSAYHRQIETARASFLNGEPVPLNLVSGSVARSWERSRQCGLSATNRSLFNEISSAHQRRVQERAHQLIGFAVPEMERLLGILPRADWVLACIDTSGVVIASLENRDAANGLRNAFRTGVDLAETTVGTTAPGCALLERKPVMINANEHFLDDLKAYSCIAVPIFDASGELIGVLDASYSYNGSPATTIDPVFVAARSIESRMVHAISDAVRVGFHYRPDMLGTPLEGILAFSESGRLLGMNHVAQRMLGIISLAHRPHFNEMFDKPLGRALDAMRCGGSAPIVLESRCGGRFAMSRRDDMPPPRKARSVDSSTPIAVDDGVRDSDEILNDAAALARRALDRGIPVLINGATGTGKDVLARQIHQSGARRHGPFVAINCSSIPAGLIESELFGYEDGAFTGGRRGGASGRFEQANGGTLFLDEIGDMPIDLQARLLRVLQDRSLTRIGGSRLVALDVAIICATHRDLKERVACGQFREDLYYRINGYRLTLPRLANRPDLDALIGHLLARATQGQPLRIDVDAMAALRRYSWPGNIRQLQQTIRLAALLAEGSDCIQLHHLHEDVLDEMQATLPLHKSDSSKSDDTGHSNRLEHAERLLIQAALERCKGNVSASARDLGIARETLYRKMRNFNLSDVAP